MEWVTMIVVTGVHQPCSVCGMPGHPIIALECKHISMRLTLWVPTVDDVAEVMSGILRREGVHKTAIVAHSYGTAVASRLIQLYPKFVAHLTLIDPVSKHECSAVCLEEHCVCVATMPNCDRRQTPPVMES